MSRSPTITTFRGTKKENTKRLGALLGQFGEHGVEVVEHVQERRGRWALRFKLTPEREAIRKQNLALKGMSAGFDLTESQRAILGALVAGFALLVSQWAGRPAYRLSSKHTREKGEDIATLSRLRLISRKGDAFTITAAGTREVLRQFGGFS